jgi:hypothetical protein
MKMFHTSVSHLIRDFSYLPVNCRYVIRNFCLCVYFRPHRSFYIFLGIFDESKINNYSSGYDLIRTEIFLSPHIMSNEHLEIYGSTSISPFPSVEDWQISSKIPQRTRLCSLKTLTKLFKIEK